MDNMNKDMNDNNAINPSIKEKKTQTFNLIIGIATLLIAIFGATFAYFTATARSSEGEVTVKSAMVSINFDRGTEVKAENLIPSSEDIMLEKYQKSATAWNVEEGPYLQDFDEFLAGEDQTNLDQYLDRRCVDAKGKEVCSVFWFSVKSEAEVGETTSINSYITVERNEFENLSYLVYKVDYNTDTSGEIVRDRYGFGIVPTDKYTLVSTFDAPVDDDSYIEETIPYGRFGSIEERIEDDNSTAVKPVACLFGVSDSTKELDDPSRCSPYPIDAKADGTPHYFQVVIWLEETGKEQLEQGKSFNGTVSVEVNGDSSAAGYEGGRITGQR